MKMNKEGFEVGKGCNGMSKEDDGIRVIYTKGSFVLRGESETKIW